MSQELYTYAVARIRTKEMSLLSNQDIEQLMSCKNYEECIKLLEDKGFGNQDAKDVRSFLALERDKTWNLMRELVEDMSVFQTFLVEYDYHNLKAAIKQLLRKEEVSHIYLTKGIVDTDLIKKAVEEKSFELLPEQMQECAKEAYEVLIKTQNSQLSDSIIDKAAMEALIRAGESSKNELLLAYSEWKVAAADIGIAVRSCLMGKSREFLERTLAPCKTLDIQRLMNAALMNQDAIYEYLETTEYADAVTSMKQSLSSFECWCDNRLIELIRPQKSNPFTISPLAAYIVARENEIKTIRILLSGKLNHLPQNSIRERMREMYV